MRRAAAAAWMAVAPVAWAGARGTPTFTRDVAPILYEHCASCHRAGGAGPFPLIQYSEARRHARQIAAVTASRYMPPWLPEPGYGDFAEERRLSAEQMATLAAWARGGAPEGPADALPPAPRFPDGWQLGTPDLILKAAQAYALPAGGPDVFWNFVYEPGLKQTRYVRAIEIRPGDARLVHHANLIVDPAGSTRSREQDGRGGFPGMDLAVERTTFDFDSHFLFWKPGSKPYSEPPGMAWALEPGGLLVLNTHMQPSGRVETVKPEVGLYFTSEAPKKLPMLVQLENDQALDIPAGDRDFEVRDDFRVPMDMDVLAVYPHAHYLGKLLEGYATLPGGARRWLIRIPRWDLNWQAVYRYREPVFLPKGTVVSMRYHYDNSADNPRNPHQPPQRVEAGDQATDEMGHLWLQVLPRGGGDRRLELEEALMRHKIGKDGGDYWANLRLGAVLLARLRPEEALEPLERAVERAPEEAEGHNLFGVAYERRGEMKEAMEEFRTALRLRPDYATARLNLAHAEERVGEREEAAGEYRRILEGAPGDETAKAGLETVLEEEAERLDGLGETVEAGERLRELVKLEPGDAEAWLRLGETESEEGKYREAVKDFERALELDPGSEEARREREEARQRAGGGGH